MHRLAPGEYEMRAEVDGYFAVPQSYPLSLPDTAAAATVPDALDAEGEFYFRFYRINNELFMPNLQVMP